MSKGWRRVGGRGGLVAALFLTAMVCQPGTAAQAQAAVEIEVGAYPVVVATTGETVQFSIEVIVPDELLPATIVALSSDVHGDVADPANPLLMSTGCEVPADYGNGTPGWVGWGCLFEAVVSGDPGEVIYTLSATVLLDDGSEVAATDTVSVTVSDRLGAIQATLVDSATGSPIPGIYVWGHCLGLDCGGFTDASGMIVFSSLEPGLHYLRSGGASPGGWAPTAPDGYRTSYAYEWYDDDPVGPAEGRGIPITVQAGETTEIRWELSVGGAVEGKVTTATGEPVPNLELAYWHTEPDGSFSAAETGGYSTVNSDGTYRLEALRAGVYLVCFVSSSGSECWNDVAFAAPPDVVGDGVEVGLGATTTGIDGVLGRPIPPDSPGNGGEGSSEAPDEPSLPRTGDDTLPLTVLALALLAAGAALLSIKSNSGQEPLS